MNAELRAIEGFIGPERSRQLLKLAQSRGLEGVALEQTLGILRARFQAGAGLGELDPVTRLLRYKMEPVPVKEFVFSKFYLGKGEQVYPEVLRELERMNSGEFDEVVCTGGIGSGKTTVALYSQAYQIYLLSLLRNPHALFGLDSSSEIKVIFQNLNARLAKSVDYARFRDMIEESPYFQRHFMFNKDLASKLAFPHRIEVEPVSGSETASIGQNVIGGIMDEVDFMAVVEDSKQASDGGVYDQAVELYNTIARRRKSRFMKAGQMPGLLCLVSSKKTPGGFTDQKEAEAKYNKRIYIYKKRVWDIKPHSFSGKQFRVFVGDESRKPRVLHDDEELPLKDAHLIDSIPVEFASEFRDDITKALRDIAGRATLAIHPFMPDAERVSANFGKYPSVVQQQKVDFAQVRPLILPKRILNPQFKRFAHIDLALRKDSAGLVIGHCPGFKKVQREETTEMLPIIAIDCSLEVKAPLNGEIEFSNIRRLLYKLRELGLPVTWVTLDSYQSVDTMQILRANGFITGYQSMDTSIVPYQIAKTALYDGRVPMPEHELLQQELLTLEMDYKRGKVDHNAHGSKDVADSLAGVIYGLTMRREIWTMNGVNPVTSPSVYQHMQEKPKEATA